MAGIDAGGQRTGVAVSVGVGRTVGSAEPISGVAVVEEEVAVGSAVAGTIDGEGILDDAALQGAAGFTPRLYSH